MSRTRRVEINRITGLSQWPACLLFALGSSSTLNVGKDGSRSEGEEAMTECVFVSVSDSSDIFQCEKRGTPKNHGKKLAITRN